MALVFFFGLMVLAGLIALSLILFGSKPKLQPARIPIKQTAPDRARNIVPRYRSKG